MSSRVSIIIPFYNCPYIEVAVSSALQQYYTNTEIIVVDDGSTQHANLLAPFMYRINYLGKSNGGTASALNHGIKYASGDYVVWLSSDDYFYPGKIMNQLYFMQQHNLLISYTNFNYMDAAGNITQYNASTTFANKRDFYQSFLTYNPVNGCTVMMRKDLFQVVGLFDENLPYTHDLDLWYRVLLHHIEFPILNQSLTAYRWHGGMGTVRHGAAITAEVNFLKQRYHDRLQHSIQQL